MKYRILPLLVLCLAFAACKDKTATSGNPSNADSAVNATAAPTNGDSAAMEEGPARPPLKAEAELNAIKQQWEATAAAEKEFLASPKLIQTVEKLKGHTDEDGFEQPGQLSEAQFAKLSLKEQMYYFLFHPEVSSQNCDMALFDAGQIQGISAWLPHGEEVYQSERQTNALANNKAEVVKIVKECLNKNKALSVEMMKMVAGLQLKELIVPMVDTYNAQTVKDDLLLTTAIEFMRMQQWPEWMSSNVAKEMDSEMGGEYGGMRDYADLTPENVNEVIALAKKFAAQ